LRHENNKLHDTLCYSRGSGLIYNTQAAQPAREGGKRAPGGFWVQSRTSGGGSTKN